MKETLDGSMLKHTPRLTDEEANALSGGIDPWSSNLTPEQKELVMSLCRDSTGYFQWVIGKGSEKRTLRQRRWQYRRMGGSQQVTGAVHGVDMTEGDFRSVLINYVHAVEPTLADIELVLRAWYYESGQLLILATVPDSERPSIKLTVGTIPTVIERHGAKLVKTDFEPAVLAALFDLQYKVYLAD